jgi:hypothetical protein
MFYLDMLINCYRLNFRFEPGVYENSVWYVSLLETYFILESLNK